MQISINGTKSDAIIFVKFDESQVPEMNMQMYNKSFILQIIVLNIQKLGEKLEVSAHLYQVNSGKTIHLDLAGFENYYIPQVFSMPKNDEVAIANFNRHQNKVEILKLILLLEPFLNY